MLITKFEEQVAQNPQAIAIKTQNDRFTYEELNQYANRIAQHINDQWHSMGNNNIDNHNRTIGLLFTHGAHMIAALLGVLKAGMVYVPLAPDYPQNRLSYMVKNAETWLLLTDTSNEANAQNVARENNIPCLNSEKIDRGAVVANPVREIAGNKLAYIIYTSGSTGLPKGVPQTHENVWYYTRNWVRIFSITPVDRLTLISSFSHDGAVQDIFATLLSGATLYPFSLKRDQSAGSLELSEFLIREKISLWHSVPSLYHYFVSTLTGAEQFPQLRFIVLGGEPVLEYHITMFQKHFPHSMLANVYGQSESSVSSIFLVRPEAPVGKVVIGKALDRTKLFLINDLGKAATPLKTGEIVVASAHISPGYWRNEEISKKVFTRHPEFGSLYWTGDLGRLLLNGDIEFTGRRDTQIKIRGYRIELGEIESLLLKHPYIKEAVVAAKKDVAGDWFLVAYIIVKEVAVVQAPRVQEWREYLAQSLPDYMIPAYFVHMESFPLTTSNKIDRKALPDPEIGNQQEYLPPTNETEIKLTRLWSDVLVLAEDKIGIQSNFFELGGHSLKAASLTLKIHKEFNALVPLEEVFKRATIKELALYIQAVEKELYLTVAPAEKKAFYPLSSAQKRLYFLQMMEETGIMYNMSQVMVLEGTIAMERLQDTFEKLIQRHENFRTAFLMIGEQSVQRIYDHVAFAIEYQDLSPTPKPGEVISRELAEMLIKDFIRPFDLSRPPLLRVAVVRLTANAHFFMVDMHHIISDGTSMGVLVKEFMELYEARPLPVLRLHYKDYAVWETSHKAQIAKQEAYWLKEFAEEIPLLALPLDYPRPPLQQFAGNSVYFTVDSPYTLALKTLALQQGMTLYMVLLAVYTIFLAKICNQDVFAVGTPVAGRSHVDLEKIIGMFVNTLVLKNNPAGEKNLLLFLGEVKEKTLHAFANQDYQYEELVEQVVKNRETSRNPLFDTMFVLQNQDIPVLENPDLKLKYYPFERYTAKFDLTLICIEMAGQLYCTLEYSTILLKQDTVQKFTHYFQKVLSSLLENPAQQISQVEIISLEEKEQILFQFNTTATEYPKDKTIPQLFAEQAHRTPDYIAISEQKTGGCQFTYAELNKKSTQLAHVLLAQGVSPDTIVAIMVERSIEMIIGILGILKAGGAYLPIDPDYPEDRKQFMLSDSAATLLLTPQFIQAATPILPRIPITPIIPTPPITPITPTNLAYIIYTSGTTGQPKGVLVTHENVVRLFFNDNFQFDFNDRDVWTMFHSYCFDFSVWEMYGALLFGGKLILFPRLTAMDTGGYVQILKKETVTILNQTPSSFYRLMEDALQMSDKSLYLRYVIFGGEALQPLKLKEWHVKYPQTKLINMYGITETTVHVTYQEITHQEIAAKVSNIGKPIPTLQVYIMDAYAQLLPIGLSGEIYVGGAGVARGYLNRPQLTHERFLAPATLPLLATKYYKTGDLARWLPDGSIEYLGRIDQQVKLRGFRIELGEIENSLLKQNQIKEAVVIVSENDSGDKCLVAYFVADIELSGTELRDYLLKELPDYMIPSYFMQLENIPLTANGKINQKVLPTPEFTPILNHYTPPNNDIERHLADIWSALLGIKKEKISVHDNFFALGGHSLKATTMMARIHHVLGIKIDLAQIFKKQTIRGLAEFIKTCAKEKYPTIEAAEERCYYELSYNQKRLWFIQQLAPHSSAYNLPGLVVLEQAVDQNKIEKTLRRLIARHDSFRTRFIFLNDEPVQVVQKEVRVPLKIIDLSPLQADEKQQKVTAIYAHEISTPFNLEEFPLFRVILLKLDEFSCALIFNMHHIISDGWSIEILKNEFFLFQAGLEREIITGIAFNPEPLKIQYKDFAVWYNTQLANRELKAKTHSFWKKRLENGVSSVQLRLDNHRKGNERKGARYFSMLGQAQTLKLKQAARDFNTTLFVVMFSLYIFLLRRFSGQEEMACYIVSAGREQEALLHIIGFFVSTELFKIQVVPTESFANFLSRVNAEVLEILDHQGYPLELVFEELNMKYPEIHVSFNMLNFGDAELRVSTKTETAMIQPSSDSYMAEVKFDLEPYIREYNNGIEINWAYKKELYNEATIEYMVTEYTNLVDFFMDAPEKSFSDYWDDQSTHTFSRNADE